MSSVIRRTDIDYTKVKHARYLKLSKACKISKVKNVCMETFTIATHNAPSGKWMHLVDRVPFPPGEKMIFSLNW